MSLNTRLTMLIGVLLLAIIGIIGSTLWVANTQNEDALVINLAGRQRMLIQRFAKEVFQEANNRQEISTAELRARTASVQITADRRYYARNVVAKLQNDWEDFKASDNHRDMHATIPLPATFLREVSESLDPTGGYRYELLSNWNINPDKGLRDAFHRKAWESLTQDPDRPYVDLVRDGEGVELRFATADAASAAVCVACHNQHPASPKTDFQLNDLMGILVVSVPITQDRAEAEIIIAARDRNAPRLSAKTRKFVEQTLTALRHGGKTFTDLSMTKPVTLPAKSTPRITEQLVEVEAPWKAMTEAASVIESESVGTQAYVAALKALPVYTDDCLREMDVACGMYQEDSENRVGMVITIQYAAGMISVLTFIGLVMYIRIKVSRPLLDALRTREERNRALEEAARFSRVLDESLNEIYILDAQTLHFVNANYGARENLGYSMEELRDLTPLDLKPEFTPESFAQLIEPLRAGTQKKVEFSTVHRRKDGTQYPVEVHLQRITVGAPVFVAIILDITERKRAQEALLSEKLLSDEYINSLPGLFYVFDEQRFIRWNREWERVTGYNAQELGSRYGTDFFEGEDRVLIEERMRRVFREGASEAEAELVTKDGRRIPYYFTGLRKVFEGKDHLVGLGIDITDRKHAQREREELIAQLEAQNAELERFTYTVSHDLKSPLITIKGYVGLLREDLAEGDSQPVEDDLAHIADAADKMGQLLRDLLELSRIGRLVNPLEEVPLEEVARDARDLVEGQARENKVQVEISPHLPVVFGDRLRLAEALQNLIDNAVKYMGDQPRPRVTVGSRRDGAETVCFVRDNGIGIEPRYHEGIFGLFDQLDPKVEGSGIGLALVKRIIEVHGGRVWVESNGSGQGSTFCFTIPARTES